MRERLLILLILIIGFSGCVTLVKEKTYCPITSDKKSDMVWVEAKTNKIWVNPHVDDSGDMVEGHYKYTIVIPGHWEDVKGKS